MSYFSLINEFDKYLFFFENNIQEILLSELFTHLHILLAIKASTARERQSEPLVLMHQIHILNNDFSPWKTSRKELLRCRFHSAEDDRRQCLFAHKLRKMNLIIFDDVAKK